MLVFLGHQSGDKLTRFSESLKSRYIFLDLGANRADTLKVFLQEPNTKFNYSYPLPDLWNAKREDAEIYLFEANPVFNVDLVKARQWALNERCPPCKAINIFPATVVWTQDGMTTFFIDVTTVTHDFWGSSMYQGSDGTKPMNLTTIDIGKFILENFLPNDFVVVKMDIEGAEYPVLHHILQSGAWVNIDYLLVEYHQRIVRDQDVIHQGVADQKELMRLGVNFIEYNSPA